MHKFINRSPLSGEAGFRQTLGYARGGLRYRNCVGITLTRNRFLRPIFYINLNIILM